jgi:polysaccharide biosynthesis/export protein
MHRHRTAAPCRPALPRILAALICAGTCGCTAVPSDGPSAMDFARVKAEDTETPGATAPHVLVTLDAEVLDKINSSAPRSFARDFKGNWRSNGRQLIGAGDRLTVNIWEPSPDGIFSTAENRQASLVAVVEEDGKIYIPYVGRLPAARRTVEGLRSAIEKGLAGKAVEPQVQVLLQDNQANGVVIMGDVAKPGQLPLPAPGLRLMEAVARAGGTRGPTYETAVTVTRGERAQTVRLGDVAKAPGDNIWLWPGDNVLVLHQPRSYSAFGAVQKSGRLAFDAETLSLMEAIAQAGGLNDRRADAGGIFLMRFEDRELAQWLTGTGKAQGEAVGPLTPVIYRLDFADPGALFIAHRLSMRDKDLLYVANHPMAELNKFLTSIVSPLLGTARGAAVLTE